MYTLQLRKQVVKFINSRTPKERKIIAETFEELRTNPYHNTLDIKKIERDCPEVSFMEHFQKRFVKIGDGRGGAPQATRGVWTIRRQANPWKGFGEVRTKMLRHGQWMVRHERLSGEIGRQMPRR